MERGVVEEPVDGSSNFEGPQDLDVDDFRRWWRQSKKQDTAEQRYRKPKLTRLVIAFGGIALVSSALAIKEGAPTLLMGPPAAPSANDIGESAGTSAEIGTMPSAPVAPAQAAGGLASMAPAQTADPEPAQRTSVRPDGALIASQVSTAVERSTTAGTPNPASKRINGGAGTRQLSTDLPAKRPGKLTAQAIVAKAERVVDAPIPPLPIVTRPKPEKQASGAQAALAVAAPADANPFPNPLVRVLGDLFGGRAFDLVPVGPPDWTVQLGAPKSEAEAKRDLKRLNAQYGSALKGSTVGLREVPLNGETVYRLDVAGLSRDEAAALCSRVKSGGGSCSIVK